MTPPVPFPVPTPELIERVLHRARQTHGEGFLVDFAPETACLIMARVRNGGVVAWFIEGPASQRRYEQELARLQQHGLAADESAPAKAVN